MNQQEYQDECQQRKEPGGGGDKTGKHNQKASETGKQKGGTGGSKGAGDKKKTSQNK